MADVVVRLSRGEALALVTTSRLAPVGLDIRLQARQKLRAALDSPPVEEQIDYRVVVGQGEDMEQRGLFIGCWESEARSAATRQRRRGFTDARVQARTVVHSPWTDLPSEEGERG